jgi:peptide/nickel transport system substrate-binding protein
VLEDTTGEMLSREEEMAMLQWLKPAFAGVILAIAGSSANAQGTTKDTVRVAVYQPIPIIDVIYNPSPETSLVANIVFDSLVYFDAAKREYVPLLAKSWQRINDKTYEFKLREGVKFHDGSTFDADDVVYSFEVYMSPKYNFRFKDNRFDWLEKVEKIDQYTVRITSKDVTAAFLGRLIAGTPIYPENIYRALDNKGDFGRNPIGTGPYRVVSFDPAKGEVVYERNEDYAMKDIRPAGSIKRIMLSSIADKQTQIAKLLSGGLDLVYEVEPDQIPSLRANPNLAVSVERTVSYTYIQFDTKNRSGVGYFKDKRVREALLKAIDRPALLKAFLPQEQWNDPPQIAMCHEWHNACAASVQPVSYDPEGAKKLLAEAGYPNGFDLTITTWGPSRGIAEAVSGQFRKIGVNAKIDASTVGVYVQKRADGKIQTAVSLWDNGVAAPDIEGTLSFFFVESSRDYIGDPALAKATDDGARELNPEKRVEIYRGAFDRVTTERYMMPLVPLPATVAHTKNLQLLPGHKSPEGFELNLLAWK